MPLSALTTIGVGGPALVCEAATTEELVALARDVWRSGEPWIVCGGGSNMVVSDFGFDGVVLAPRSRGVRVLDDRGGEIVVEVDAGFPWDGFVAESVARGWGGAEALSGIPGLVGAAPIQNIGAYGTEFAQFAGAVLFLDALSGRCEWIRVEDCGFGYRSSVFKAGRDGVVLAVQMRLRAGGYSAPVAYGQLADRLGVPLGSRVPGAEVREAVLGLRRAKGMVFDPGSADTRGCGSFFVNPIVDATVLSALPSGAPHWPVDPHDEPPVRLPLDGSAGIDLPPRPQPGRIAVKLSAAWLIERAGISKGFRLPGSRAAISSVHTLAITNRGGASAADVLELARFVQTRVASEFGVVLQPEPRLVGVEF